jgi:hypothetical protein
VHPRIPAATRDAVRLSVKARIVMSHIPRHVFAAVTLF